MTAVLELKELNELAETQTSLLKERIASFAEDVEREIDIPVRRIPEDTVEDAILIERIYTYANSVMESSIELAQAVRKLNKRLQEYRVDLEKPVCVSRTGHSIWRMESDEYAVKNEDDKLLSMMVPTYRGNKRTFVPFPKEIEAQIFIQNPDLEKIRKKFGTDTIDWK